MEDKRALANQELSDTFGGGILSLSPEEPKNFVELQPQEEKDISNTTPSMLNNFNVNVNINGSSNNNTTIIEKTASEAVKKALPTTAETPEEIKKNLSVPSTEKFDLSLKNLVESDYSDIMYPGFTPTFNPSNYGISVPSLNYSGVDMFELPEMSTYEYSNADIKENNPNVQRTFGILKNIIHHSLTTQEITNLSPSSMIDQSSYVQEIMGERRYFNTERINVQNNQITNMDAVNELTKEKQKQENLREEQTNKMLKEITKNSKRNIEENIDNQGGTSIQEKNGAPINNSPQKRDRAMSHLNPTPTTIDMFFAKMNSPPSWRTTWG